MPGWRNDYAHDGSVVDVMPVEDVVDHEWGDGCICGPTEETYIRGDLSVGKVFTHHSLDNREAVEH